MLDSRKILGVVILFAVAFAAGSVVCTASGQPGAMANCGGGMVPAAMCPFMSASVPTAVGISPIMKILGLVGVLFMAIAFTSGFSPQDDRCKKLFIHTYERRRDLVTGRRSDTVLNLISDGILQPRVFGF